MAVTRWSAHSRFSEHTQSLTPMSSRSFEKNTFRLNIARSCSRALLSGLLFLCKEYDWFHGLSHFDFGTLCLVLMSKLVALGPGGMHAWPRDQMSFWVSGPRMLSLGR